MGRLVLRARNFFFFNICTVQLQDKNVGVVESIQGMAVQAKGNFVVTLEPLS